MVSDGQRKTFLSYSRANKDFSMRLAKELKSEGFLIWFDQMDIPAGSRWDREVEKALRECDIFMIILTPASVDSENVLDEIGYAIDNRKQFLPVLLENCDVPLRLRRFQYVDFTNKSFDDGVESAKELLKNLIAQTTIPRGEVSAQPQDQMAKVEVDRKTKGEAEQIAERIANEELSAKAQAEIDRKVKEEAGRLTKQKAEDERLAKTKAETEHKATEEANRLAAQKAKANQNKIVPIATEQTTVGVEGRKTINDWLQIWWARWLIITIVMAIWWMVVYGNYVSIEEIIIFSIIFGVFGLVFYPHKVSYILTVVFSLICIVVLYSTFSDPLIGFSWSQGALFYGVGIGFILSAIVSRILHGSGKI